MPSDQTLLRSHVKQIRDLPIRTAKGALVPLSQLADVETFTGPKTISRNKASRRTYVQLNVRGRDMGSVVMVDYINELRDRGMELMEAVKTGAEHRLRPVMMTATVAILGLVPLLLANDIGSNVQRPLAAVVVGGLVTSTLLTLVVLPTIYKWFAEPVEHVEV